MTRYLLILLLWTVWPTLSFKLYAQKEADVWLTGAGHQLNFQSGQPELAAFEGPVSFCSSICDDSGNLLLYSNGYKIWNKNHEVIINGDSLIREHSWVENQPFFLPHPGKKGWYIFIFEEVEHYIQNGFYGNTLYYAEINPEAYGGKGELTGKKIKIHDNYHSAPTIAGYCNNSYYWLAIDRNENIVRDIGRDRIYFYRIGKNGLNTEPVINGTLDIGNSTGFQFSPNGDKLFFVVAGQSAYGKYVVDFNFEKGDLYNFRYLPFSNGFWKTFSSNSSFFYYFSDSYLFQVDVRFTSTGRVQESTEKILMLPSSADYNQPGTALRLAPDGMIYFAYTDTIDGKRKLGRLQSPNAKGMKCNPVLNVMELPSGFRFPRFMPGFFREKQPENLDEVFPDAGPDLVVCPREAIRMGKEGTPEAFYSWIPEAHLSEILSAQTVFTAPMRFNQSETAFYTLKVTDGNCWINFDTVTIVQRPAPKKLPVDGSWSVCPFVEEVKYWSENSADEIHWVIDGGEMAGNKEADSIKVNWWDTNPKASVGIYAVNTYECKSDTTIFPVRINVELITETPGGPENLCVADRNNNRYQIRNTNGSVYDWSVNGGEIVNGQGTNRITVNWLYEGRHSLVVKETSTTIDTICYGESEPLWVEVVNDSLEINLENLSYDLHNNVEVSYHSPNLQFDNHYLTILAGTDGATNSNEVAAPGRINGRTIYSPSGKIRQAETIRLKVKNACDELFVSNPLETIVLDAPAVMDPQVHLTWNENRFWLNDRVNYQVWHTGGDLNNWQLVAENLDGNQYDFINSGLELIHYFRVKAVNLDENKESWSNWVQIELEDVLEIPDVFTPNGDGINDVWEIRNIRFHELQRATIYNRYGQKVYECRNGYVPWDGQINGQVIQETYLYELVFSNGTSKHGQITILQ